MFLRYRAHAVPGQKRPERKRGGLIEQNAHSAVDDWRLHAARCEIDHSLHLIAIDAVVPFDDGVNVGTCLEVLKDRRDGHPRPPQHPGAAHLARDAFNRRASGPVDDRRPAATALFLACAWQLLRSRSAAFPLFAVALLVGTVGDLVSQASPAYREVFSFPTPEFTRDVVVPAVSAAVPIVIAAALWVHHRCISLTAAPLIRQP